MRSHEDVIEKFEELRRRKLAERLEKLLRRSYGNCIHNVLLNVRENGKVGFCQNPKLLSERKKVLVCNDDAFCARCEHYQCKHTEETVEKEFEFILQSPARCGEDFPKLAVLIWVLQENTSGVGRLRSRLGFIKARFKKFVSGLATIRCLRGR